MADRPILFSSAMILALLAGRKTQTRRIIGVPAIEAVMEFVKVGTDKSGVPVYEMKDAEGRHVYLPKGKHFATPHYSPRFAKGDRLWCRETWRTEARYDSLKPSDISPAAIVSYDADYSAEPNDGCRGKTRVAIHMPRWASRLTLTVTDVRVQRLQEISSDDALAEGVNPLDSELVAYRAEYRAGDGALVSREETRTYVPAYRRVWSAINGADSWAANPWVVAVTFKPEHRNIDS